MLPGSASSLSVVLDEVAVEQLEVGVAQIRARAREAILELPVEVEHLLVEAVEVLGVAGLVDLLGEQERLLVLVLGRQHEARELVGDALLADEERRQPVHHLLALVLVQRLPVAPIGVEVDLVRRPVLALPQPVELERRHQLDLRQLGLVADRRHVALNGEVQQARHRVFLLRAG